MFSFTYGTVRNVIKSSLSRWLRMLRSRSDNLAAFTTFPSDLASTFRPVAWLRRRNTSTCCLLNGVSKMSCSTVFPAVRIVSSSAKVGRFLR